MLLSPGLQALCSSAPMNVPLMLLLQQDMTYSKQLEQYEEAVMQKRLEEMPETERSRLYEEVEAEKARRTRS